MRKPLIAGNWKMFLTLPGAVELVNEIIAADIDYNAVDVAVSPSFISLFAVAAVVEESGKPLIVAAQNAHFEDEGAYTGEISLPMLQSCGASAVILGHSERRTLFGETDAAINLKLIKAVTADMMAILCVGELLEEREAAHAEDVVLDQLRKALTGISGLDLTKVVIAYEPVWAIGTGKTASAADAQKMHAAIRAFIAKTYGTKAAEAMHILYGGSVKPDNIRQLIAEQDIDGALVGGASLKADQFIGIIKGASGKL